MGKNYDQQKRKNDLKQQIKLTQRIPHPVGTNAKMEANMSVTDRSVKITATATPVRAIKKERPWMKRNRSWKLTDIFWLKVNTCETEKKEYSIPRIMRGHGPAKIFFPNILHAIFKVNLHLEKNYENH